MQNIGGIIRTMRGFATFSSKGAGLKGFSNPRSTMPLIEHYNNTWPAPEAVIAPAAATVVLPDRTIPDHKLRFQMKSTFATGSSIFYPHLKFHPADFKVGLVVSVSDLGLTKEELSIFIEMVGPRFNQGKRIVRLTSERFPNRIENKKYLIFLLETLLLEAKRLAQIAPTLKAT